MKRKLCVMWLLLFLLPPLICLLVLLPSKRAIVTLDSLLLDISNFPTQWDTGEIEVISIEWEISPDNLILAQSNAFYSASNLGRTWSDGGAELSIARISEHVYLYNSPLASARQYWLSRPEIAYGRRWPNFTSPKRDDSDRYPSNWEYESPFADQEHVVCAMGSPESCQVWYYWARYGQYLLSVEFFAPNQGMDAALFVQIVTQIDSHVGQQLDR